MSFNRSIVMNLLIEAFREFNYNIADQGRHLLGLKLDDFNEYLETLTLYPPDCESIAHAIVHFVPNPANLTKHLKKGIAPYNLRNSVIIYYYPLTNNIRILIKPNVKYTNQQDRQKFIFNGIHKIIKPHGLLIELSAENQGSLVFAGNEVIWSRVASKTKPIEHESHTQKKFDFDMLEYSDLSPFIGFQKIEYLDFLDNVAILYHQPYQGVSISHLQNQNPLFASTKKQIFRGALMFGYLKSIYQIMHQEKFWPSDLKPDNTCLKLNSRLILNVSIIDYYNVNGSAFSLFKKDLLGPWSMARGKKLLAKIRNPHQRKMMIAKDFKDMRHQLIFEILHMLFILSCWPYVHYIHNASRRYQFPTNFQDMDVQYQQSSLKFNIFANNPYYTIITHFLLSINSDYPVTFADILSRINKSEREDLFVFPAEFKTDWQSQFIQVGDNFRII